MRLLKYNRPDVGRAYFPIGTTDSSFIEPLSYQDSVAGQKKGAPECAFTVMCVPT
jgi:hypothetical protein